MVLPPTVVGYYLLMALGRDNPLIDGWACAFCSPGARQPRVDDRRPAADGRRRAAAIAKVDPALENAARTLGSSELEVLWRVTLPLARRGSGGLVWARARAGRVRRDADGGGQHPRRTQTLPLAIYDAVQNRQYGLANEMVALLTGVAFFSCGRCGSSRIRCA